MHHRLINLFFVFLFPFLAFSNYGFERFTTNDGLISNQVYGIKQDANGRIWVACTKGVGKFTGLGFENFNLSNYLGDDIIVGLKIDNQGKAWVFSSSGKLFFFNGERFVPFALNDGISQIVGYNLVNDVCFEGHESICITTILGDFLVKVSPTKITSEKINSKDLKYYIIETSNGNFITGNNRKNEYEQVFFKSEEVSFNLPLSGGTGISKSHFYQLKSKDYLYGKDFELLRFNSKGLQQRIFLEKSIECLVEDSEENIWVGLNSGGVVKLPSGELQKKGLTKFLTTKTINDLFFDNSGNLWIATSNSGVYLFNPTPGIVYEQPEVYSKPEDTSQVASYNPLEIDYLPISNSEKVKIGESSYPPLIFISGVAINDEDTTVLNQYDLAYNENFILFSFVGASASNIDQLQYKYRLKGINNDWVYTSSNKAQYTTLPPGEYFFEVNVMNKEGIWGTTPANITINIDYPFWQKWWFVLIALASIGLIIVFSLRNYISSIRKKEQEKAEVEKRIADLELQALRAQMNPHFLFNTISSIQYYITANDTKSALKYLSKFAKLMRAIMENSKSPRISLGEELRVLDLYLELESLRFKGKFEYTVELKNDLIPNEETIPPMLIQPYIENALNHGIVNKEGKGHIKVEIKRQNGHLICSVEDDGIGRKKAEEIKSKKAHSHISRGMSITKSRLEIINKVNQSDLNVEIEDLEIAGEAKGTKVKIYVPQNS